MVAAMHIQNENDRTALGLRTTELRNVAIGFAVAIALIMVAGQISDSGSASGSDTELTDSSAKRFVSISITIVAGDNVVTYPDALTGIARHVRTSDKVLEYLTGGVPADTIAIVDDSGGTLTAPILEKFKGVLCAGGTTRSHLAILTREYGIPCLMNSRLSGIKDGDTLAIETSAKAKTTDDYQSGVEASARVWRTGKS